MTQTQSAARKSDDVALKDTSSAAGSKIAAATTAQDFDSTVPHGSARFTKGSADQDDSGDSANFGDSKSIGDGDGDAKGTMQL